VPAGKGRRLSGFARHFEFSLVAKQRQVFYAAHKDGCGLPFEVDQLADLYCPKIRLSRVRCPAWRDEMEFWRVKYLRKLDVSLDQSTQASSLQRSEVIVGRYGTCRIHVCHGVGVA
jgi:hypothetical protein